jgi:hypothetical protein
MKVETTNELVLKAAMENPEAERVLMTMFPSVFEDKVAACQIGSVFFRKDYPNNVYAVIKKNGTQIIVMNITHCATWEPKITLKLSELTDRSESFITIREFKALTGYKDMDKFIFVPIGCNNLLGKLADRFHEAFND